MLPPGILTTCCLAVTEGGSIGESSVGDIFSQGIGYNGKHISDTHTMRLEYISTPAVWPNGVNLLGILE